MTQTIAEIERVLTQKEFDTFADLSGDNNPIHVDAEYSASTRFGRNVAHGILLSTILRGLVGKIAPGARMETQQLMFPAPTFAGERMHFSACVQSRNQNRIDFAISCKRVDDGEVTCQGLITLVTSEE